MDNSRLSPPPQAVKSEVIEEVQVLMNFYDALKEARKGLKISRLSWAPEISFGLFQDSELTLFLHGRFHKWTVNDGDVDGEDWVVIR